LSRIYTFIIVILLTSFALFGQINTENMLFSESMYSVSVAGAVKTPGVYRLLPTSRISEVINRANYDKPIIIDGEIVPKEPDLLRPSLRNIILKREGDELKLDLKKFYLLGHESENPYIQDGDMIVVPAIQNEVSIFGSINNPGVIEIAEGDRLRDIINLSLGLKEGTQLEKCKIIRHIEDSRNYIEIPIDLRKVMVDSSSEDNLLIENRDRIFIWSLPDYHRKEYVSIRGEINYPGIYPVDGLSTSLSDILRKAEIKAEISDLENAVFMRKTINEEIDPEFERLKLMTSTEMTFLEYEYFKTKIRDLQGKFSTDFELALKNPYSEKDVILKNKDFIFIPKKELTITISGKVNNPGLVIYLPSMNYLDYINSAGGYAWRAKKSKVRLIKGKTGIWIKPDEDTVIEPGDEIFVPEKPIHNYWTIAKDTIVLLSQIATLILVVQNASSP